VTQPGWPAPTSARVAGQVTVPGSKSETNRALILAALADSPGTITGGLRARDTDLMCAALTCLGVRIDRPAAAPGAPEHWHVEPLPARRDPSPAAGADRRIDVGLAGTVMRFVPPVAALTADRVHFDGDERARSRPMAGLVDALRAAGAQVSGTMLPLTVTGTGGLPGGEVSVEGHASSQYLSALLLVGARTTQGLTLHLAGDRLVSAAHIEMTIEMLGRVGVTVGRPDERTWVVHPGPIPGHAWQIAADLSNAAAYLAAALAAGGEVSVPGWPAHTSQAGAAFLTLAELMGGRVSRSGDVLTLMGTGHISGLTADLSAIGELTPTVAALASLAEGPSRLTGIGHLRGHETDRLAAIAANVNALGGAVTVEPDGLRIDPRPLRGGDWPCHGDHRMATAGALIGLRVPGVVLDDVACTAKTLPDFPHQWQQLIR